MQFLYPQFLYAFFTLLIPILIHLFYFRRFKTIYFSNVRFLSQLREERQTRSRLKNWLVLITRLLILSALILAFAQPYFPKENAQKEPGKNAISIFIDNSFSMRSVGEQGNLIEIAKKKAREIAQSYREADQFQVLTNEFKVENQQFFNKADFFNQIEEIKSNPNAKPLATVIQRQSSLLKEQNAAKKIAFIVSDFQKSTSKLQNIATDSNIQYYFIPLNASKKANLFIDSAWLASPTIQVNQNNTLKFLLKNTGDEKIEDLTVKLTINEQQKGLATKNIGAGESTQGQIVFKVGETGWNTGYLEIKDYPITFDDKYFISYPVKKQARVLVINRNSNNPYLNAGFGTDPYFQVDNRKKGNLDYSAFPEYDFIILNELSNPSSGLVAELKDFVQEGGNTLLLPPSNAAANQMPYSELLNTVNANEFTGISKQKQSVTHVNFDHPLFQDVFEEIPDNVRLPKAKKFYQSTSFANTRERVLMKLNKGQSLLSLYPYQQGTIFVSAIPFDKEWSNMTQNAIFVPMIYKMAFYQEKPRQLAYKIGKNQVIEVDKKKTNQDKVFKLVKGDFEVIPPQKRKAGNWRLYINNQIPEAGIYRLLPNNREKGTKEDKNIPHFAFNFNRDESQMATYSKQRLKRFTRENNVNLVSGEYANLSHKIKEVQKGQFLWKTFLWLALGLLLIEVLLLKILP